MVEPVEVEPITCVFTHCKHIVSMPNHEVNKRKLPT